MTSGVYSTRMLLDHVLTSALTGTVLRFRSDRNTISNTQSSPSSLSRVEYYHALKCSSVQQQNDDIWCASYSLLQAK